MTDKIIDDLTCPITHELLEDPVALPCCGRAISRSAVIDCMYHSPYCPMCKEDISHFDTINAPKLINLAYMIENIKNNATETTQPQQNNSDKWSATIEKVPLSTTYKTVIGKLQISNENKKSCFKTLLVPVVDESGSMGGSPNKQVKYSLNRVLDNTYKYNHLVTNIIAYDDKATTTVIDTYCHIDFYKGAVERIGRGGGTSFRSAFDEIVKTCKANKNNTDISSLVIVFLTDGEDSSVPKNMRGELVDALKQNIIENWDREFVIHTVGFGSNHDHEFLNKLRLIGTKEGAYRYADPSEDGDILSNKINSILDVIVQQQLIPIVLKSNNFSAQIIAGENDLYWINLTRSDLSKPLEIVAEINGTDLISIPVELVEPVDPIKLKKNWYSYLIDEIARETVQLNSNTSKSLDKQIHCELLLQRSRSIMMHLDSNDSNNYERLEKLVELVKQINNGSNVDQLKLNDMQFEGKYVTQKSQSVTQKSQYSSTYGANMTQSAIPVIKKPVVWETITLKGYKRCLSKDKTDVFFLIGCGSNKILTDLIITNNTSIHNLDENGSNLLIVASATGRYRIVKALLEAGIFDVNYRNHKGYSALDMASIYGYWNTVDLLVSHGATVNLDSQKLLRTNISKGHFNTAYRLVKNKISMITDDMIDNAPTNEALNWLSNNTMKNISYETAIIRGMFDIVQDQLEIIKANGFSWKPYIEIFKDSKPEHLMITDLLLKNKIADPEETVSIVSEEEEEIVWPLFITAERGNVSMFKLLMRYVSPEHLNKQNKKGTTALWMASCNRHIDIVAELLSRGADPNICNYRGENPLIPCCQKGSKSIIELLLEAGTSLDGYNKERDNAVLICCRNGQAEILDLLLSKLDETNRQKFLTSYAEIDGFNPLFASTELDRTECIRVCHKYGSDLESRTASDNKIIAGATPVHLACFYNRLGSLKILQELGANLLAKTTIDGDTALHIAIKKGHANIVRYLLLEDSIGKQCLELENNDGRRPVYYAKMNGNEKLYEEFFVNKLSILLEKSLFTDEKEEQLVARVLSKHGRSLGCFEFDKITDLDLGNGSTIATLAILGDRSYLRKSLEEMGIDWNKRDDMGVSPAFWQALLDRETNVVDPNVKIMLDRVQKVASKNLQNKLLTNIKTGIPQITLVEDKTINQQLIKMNDGFSSNVKNNVLAVLKSSGLVEYSILGFLDKLKNNKFFPNGKESADYIIWDAKINIIRMIASGQTNLDPIHLIVLYLYSSNLTIFQNVNRTLTNWTNAEQWHPFIGCLYQAIEQLPVYKGEVYRGVDTVFDLETYKIGNTIKWSTFSITSKLYTNTSELIKQKQGIIFIIQSKSGRDISKYSKSPVDSEVIFLPESEFVIKNYYVADQIALAQSNIRNTTFAIEERDIQKAVSGKCCILIELEEVSKSSNTVIEEL